MGVWMLENGKDLEDQILKEIDELETYRQAQSRVKMLEKMSPISMIVTSDVLPINIPAPDKLLSPPIVALDDVSVGYVPGKPVLRGSEPADRQRRPHRAARPNGNGKSTLVKLIAARLEPMKGSITRAARAEGRLLRPAPARRIDAEATGLRTHPRTDARRPETKIRAHGRLDGIFRPSATRRSRSSRAARRRG